MFMYYQREDARIIHAYKPKKNLTTLNESTEYNEAEMAKHLSAEEYSKFEQLVQAARIQLYRKASFFSIVLSQLKVICTYKMPTMAVDDRGNIYMNPRFTYTILAQPLTGDAKKDAEEKGVLPFDIREITGVLAHETMHIVNLTMFRKGARDHQLWNVATDYIMNRDLLIDGFKLPSIGCIPVNKGGRWIVDMLKQHGTSIDITEMTSEELYEALSKSMQNCQKGQKSQKGQRGQPGQGGGGGDYDEIDIEDIKRAIKEQEKLDKHLEGGEEPEEGQGGGGTEAGPKGVPGGGADREGEGGPSVRDRLKQIINRAIAQARGEGSGLPTGVIDIFGKKGQVDWREVLRRFMSIPAATRYTFNRLRTNLAVHKIAAPQLRPEDTGVDIVVGIDTSGSISEEGIRTFYTEVVSIFTNLKKVRMRVLFWHSNVYLDVDLSTEKGSINNVINKLKSLRVAPGSTTLSCIKDYLDDEAKKNKKQPPKLKGLIIFTDGYIESAPNFPNAEKKLFFITSPGGDDSILRKYGQTYKINVLE